jgi:hypothetical protein
MNHTTAKTWLVAALPASACALLTPGVASAQALFGCTAQQSQLDTWNVHTQGSEPVNAIGPNTSYIVANNNFTTGDQQSIWWCPSTGSFSVRASGPGLGFPNIQQGQVFNSNVTTGWVTRQASAITTWPVAWHTTGKASAPGSGGGFWNSTMEVWASKTATQLTCANYVHPDGIELMVWTGTNSGNTPDGLQPVQGSPVLIDGKMWNVYINGNQTTPDCPSVSWHYVAYYPANNPGAGAITQVYINYKAFMNDAKTRTCGSGSCFDDSWYINSIQAGVESDNAGVGFESDAFWSAQNAPSPTASYTGTFVGPPLGGAKSMASGWAIGTDSQGGGNFGIYEWDLSTNFWSEIQGAAVTANSDLNGNGWVINSAGGIYDWNGHGWSAFGPSSFVASAVASGSTADETWAIRKSDKVVFHYSSATNTWNQVNALANAIAVFSAPDTTCAAHPHSPVLIGTDGQIYFYHCGDNAFHINGSGVSLSTDLLVGSDGRVYVWTGSFWTYYADGPWGTDTQIAGWQDGIYMMPSAGTQTLKIPPGL